MPRNIIGPVVRGDDFWGREADFDRAWALVERGSVLLTGPRRHGKTSLMSAMQDRPRTGWTVVHAHVEYVQTPMEFATELSAALVQQEHLGAWLRRARGLPATLTRWIQQVLDQVEVGIDNMGSARVQLREALAEPLEWSERARELLDAMARFDGRVLVVLDEFPAMIATMLQRDQADAIRFLRWFRALRQPGGPRNVVFLVGGSVNIEPHLSRIGQEALINDLQRLAMEPLSPERAAEFVRCVFAHEGLIVTPDVAQAVVRHVGVGVPFFLQLLIGECRALSERPLTPDLVARAYSERVLGPHTRHRFTHYESRLREFYGNDEAGARIVLAALASGPKPDEAVRATVALRGKQDFERLMTLLEGDYYVIRSEIGWQFTHDILRDWWARHGTAPAVRRSK
jgi:hypothetical protein